MRDPAHLDEAATRTELSRVFDVCLGCRRCTDLCPSFPTLFDLVDAASRGDVAEAGDLVPAQQDLIVDGCFQCKRCLAQCPYAPPLDTEPDVDAAAAIDTDDGTGSDTPVVDMPRTMLRAMAMRHANGHLDRRDRRAARTLGRIDRWGRLGARWRSVANRLVTATPGSLLRRALSGATGITAMRPVPSFAEQRFSIWFARRPRIRIGRAQGAVTVFPTCLVEFQAPEVGADLVKVYERNGIECSVSGAGCCGAPSLHAGDLDRFTQIAERNVSILAAEVRAGKEIVVPQPSCCWVLRHDYVDHAGAEHLADAELVAAHTHDASQFLVDIDQGDHSVLDTDFVGATHRTITYHAPVQLQADHIGYRGRDLMRLTGARVRLVQQGSGLGSPWGHRATHDDVATDETSRLAERLARHPGDVLAGDCLLADAAITGRTGVEIVHPVQLIARAYGIAQERHAHPPHRSAGD